MGARAPSPWPLLVSKLRRAYRAPVSHAEIAGAGLDAPSLLEARLIERLGSGRWSPPDCEHACAPHLDFEMRRAEGLVGVACPEEPACWSGLRWFPIGAVELFACSASATLAALAAMNGLAPLQATLDSSMIPVGMLERRGLRLPVVFMLRRFTPFDSLCIGLRRQLGDDGLVVILGGGDVAVPPSLRSEGVVVIPLCDGATGDLQVWRALDLLDPGYRQRRATDPSAIFDDARLEFSHVPGDHHLLRINGTDVTGFQRSDQKFLRLLYLAAARRADADIDGGGWLEKFKLQGDDKDHDLEALREELRKGDHPDLSREERGSLIKSSAARDGRIRLAVPPVNISFDPSIAGLALLGEPAATARKGRGATPGTKELERNLARGQQVAKKLLGDVRKLGVVGAA